jgi:hypothetical protein
MILHTSINRELNLSHSIISFNQIPSTHGIQIKQPPRLVQLTFNPFTKETNYQLFKEQLHSQCLRMKEIGSAINTLTLPIIPSRAALAANAGPDEEFIWKKGEERRLNRTYAQEDSLREIYSLIMGYPNACRLRNRNCNSQRLPPLAHRKLHRIWEHSD